MITFSDISEEVLLACTRTNRDIGFEFGVQENQYSYRITKEGEIDYETNEMEDAMEYLKELDDSYI